MNKANLMMKQVVCSSCSYIHYVPNAKKKDIRCPRCGVKS